jgi:hypothetical protein
VSPRRDHALRPDPGAVRQAKAAQEFSAGAHPVRKDLVLRADDGRRLLVLAVDEDRQTRLRDLFAAHDASPTTAAVGTTAWKVLHEPATGRALAIRLDVVVTAPIRCRFHLLFSPRNELVVRAAISCGHVCLLPEVGFAALETTGRCDRRGLVLPAPPAQALRAALAG